MQARLEVLDAIDSLYQSKNSTCFVASALRLAAICFPSAVVAFHSINSRIDDDQAHHCDDPRVDNKVRAAWRRYAMQSPVVRYYLAGGTDPTIATQDLISDYSLRQTALYAECWKPTGVTHQLGLRLWAGSRIAGLSIKRDGRFVDEECRFVRSIYPHFRRAWQTVVASELATETNDIFLGQDFEILNRSPREVLGFLGQAQLDEIRHTLRRWAAGPDCNSRSPFSFDAVASPKIRCRVAEAAAGIYRLSVRRGGAHTTAIASLTESEREVIRWVAQGKRNGEIAVILDKSPATVKTQVESILRKLGAETRGSAVAIWRELDA